MGDPSTPKQSHQRTFSLHVIKEPFAGACAGVVGTVLGYPFDAVKTRMQTSHSGISDAVRMIYRENSIYGFYRGVAAPLLSLTILNSLNFSSYTFFCQHLFGINHSPQSNKDNINAHEFNWRYGVAAACVGPLSASISTPFELVKTQAQLLKRNQTPLGEGLSGSVVGITRHLITQHGVQSIYRGHVVNTVREMTFLSVYFTTYEHLKLNIVEITNLPKAVAIAVSGGVSGALGWLVSFPLDNIKSNIQGAVIDATTTRPNSFRIGRELIRSRGWAGLYSGVTPSIARAFLVSASRFSAYEAALKLVESMD